MTKEKSNQGILNSLEHSIMKKRRGRQPRASLLNANLEHAVTTFASRIGGPIVQPGKFRDFSGWLNTINGSEYTSAWESLCKSFINERDNVDPEQLDQLKIDIVHDIINRVVKQQPHESPKLVKTNARRQSNSNPQSGHTVMSIFQSRLNQTMTAMNQQNHSVVISSAKAGPSNSSNQNDSHSNKGKQHGSSQSSHSRGPNHRVHGGNSSMEISSLLNLPDDSHPPPNSRGNSSLPSMSDLLGPSTSASNKKGN